VGGLLNAGITDAGYNVGGAIFVAGIGDPGNAAFKERRLPSRRSLFVPTRFQT